MPPARHYADCMFCADSAGCSARAELSRLWSEDAPLLPARSITESNFSTDNESAVCKTDCAGQSLTGVVCAVPLPMTVTKRSRPRRFWRLGCANSCFATTHPACDGSLGCRGTVLKSSRQQKGSTSGYERLLSCRALPARTRRTCCLDGLAAGWALPPVQHSRCFARHY